MKLLEIWKGLNIADYPLKIEQQQTNPDRVTRAEAKEKPCEIGFTNLTQKYCISDAVHIWNKAPESIHQINSLYEVKKQIKIFVISLPI